MSANKFNFDVEADKDNGSEIQSILDSVLATPMCFFRFCASVQVIHKQ